MGVFSFIELVRSFITAISWKTTGRILEDSNIMKIFLWLFLVAIVGVNAGKRPCPGSNIASCTCADGTSVTNPRECGRGNKPSYCTCVDESTWTPPTRAPRPSPCSDSNPPVSCTCEDDTEVDTPRECGRGNKPKFCTCSDGEQVTKPPRG